MESSFDLFALWLLRASWQASVLIVLVLLAQWLFRSRLSPSWRFNLWLLVMVRLALPVAPESGLSIFNLAGSAAGRPPVLIEIPRPEVSSSVIDQVDGVDVSPAQTSSPAGAESGADSDGITLLEYVGFAWLMGAGFLFVRLVGQNAGFRRRLRGAQAVNDARVLELLESCRRELRLSWRPDVIETKQVASPALYGSWRPRLLLPEGMIAEFSSDELRYVFLHELAHLKRKDPAINWAMTILQIAHWFNPVVWFAGRRMRADREMACDALALGHSSEEQCGPYGQTIIKILERLNHTRPMPGLVGILEDKQQLERRITMIARFKKTSRWPVAALLLVIVLSAAALTDAQSENSDGRDDAAKSEAGGSPGAVSAVATPARSSVAEAAQLFIRTYKVDPIAFMESLEQFHPNASNDISEAIRRFFRSAGVDFPQYDAASAHPGTFEADSLVNPTDLPATTQRKAIYYKDRSGILLVRATKQDLEIIEQVVQVLNVSPPQIQIEAKLVEVSQGETRPLGFDWMLGNPAAADNSSAEGNGQVEAAQERLKELRQRYAERHPKIREQLALVSRLEAQAQVKSQTKANATMPRAEGSPKEVGTVTGILTDPQFRVVVRALEQRGGMNILMAPKITTLSGRQAQISVPEEGFSLDLNPTVAADGHSIQMTVSLVLDTLGANRSGKEPARVSTTVVVWDGQTMVLGGIPKETVVTRDGKNVTEKKNVVLFLTSTVVDPAGNRVHTGE